MKKRHTKTLIRVLCFLLALTLFSAEASALNFTDVAQGIWYTRYIERLSDAGIVVGIGDGTFLPERSVRVGEFIKMTALVSGIEPVGVVIDHWSQPYWNALKTAGALEGTGLKYSAAKSELDMTRYEMAALISRLMTVKGQTPITYSSPESVIPDYGDIPASYADAVVQVYASGIITGYDDGSFFGDRLLTRAQSAAVIVRINDVSERKPSSFPSADGSTPPTPPPAPSVTPVEPPQQDTTPFAIWANTEGHLNSSGVADATLRTMLFGSSTKSYFANASEAAPYMTEVTVPVWKINSSAVKYASTAKLTVHKLVADDVINIFSEIFADPEHFPIESVGGARYGDTMRHAWGCAIDINWQHNAYGYYSGGVFKPVTGNYWKPATDEYGIAPNGSVVRIFKKYGWGWGGQGYSSGYYDYMHFSIMTNGG